MPSHLKVLVNYVTGNINYTNWDINYINNNAISFESFGKLCNWQY